MNFTFRTHPPRTSRVSVTDYLINEYEKEVDKMERRVKLEQQIVKEWDIELERLAVLDHAMKRRDVIRELEMFFVAVLTNAGLS
jgi:hypothetical protein